MNQIGNVKCSIAEGILSNEQLKQLDMAYAEDSSSAMNWLTSVLRLMKERLSANFPITISAEEKIVIMKTPEQLAQWIVERFPEALRDLR